MNTVSKPGYLKNFYLRRTLRIFPLYYLILVLFFIVPPLLNFTIERFAYFSQNQLWFWLYFQNWLFIKKPPGNNLLLTHLWSLAVEEQFYLIWPFIILLIKRAKVLFYLMLGLLFTVMALRYFIWTYKIENFVYFNLYTFSRIDGICIGSMLALIRIFNRTALQKLIPLIVFTLAGVNFIFYFFNKQTDFTLPFMAIVGYTTFAVLFGLLINEGIKGNNKFVNIVFNNKPLRFFGKISYGLYVFHWPFYLLANPVLIEQLGKYFKGDLPLILSASISTIASIALSTFSFYYFESFFLKMKKTIA